MTERGRSRSLVTMSTTFVLPGGTRVGAPLVVRVAGVPARALESIRIPRAYAAAVELVELHRRLTEQSAAIADDLYAVIGDESRVGWKPHLVGLRRSVYRIRAPRPHEWNPEIASVLGESLARRIAEWLELLRKADRLRTDLPGVLDDEWEAAHAALRAAASADGFRRALCLASHSLFGETEKWLADEGRRPQRKSVVRLARYLGRAATKTSPYSTFTAIGEAGWCEDEAVVRFTATRPAVASVVEMNGMLVQRLIRALCERPRVAHLLRPRINPSATVDDGSIRFLGHQPKEPIVRLPLTPAVRECIRVLDGGHVATMGELVDALASSGERDAAARFVDKLVASGLVERQMPVDDLAVDPLGGLSDWLVATGHDSSDHVLAAVNRVRKEVASPAAISDITGHRQHRRALAEAIGDLAAAAGFPDSTVAGQEKDLFNENAVYPTIVASASISRWRPALTDLDVVRRMMAVLDPTLPLRVAVGTFCAERFGAGSRVPLITVHAAIAEEFSRGDRSKWSAAVSEMAGFLGVVPVAIARLAESPLDALREVERAQTAIRALMAGDRAGEPVVRANPDDVDRLLADLPAWMTAPSSMGTYVQVVPDGDGLRLVVNAAHGGHGRGRSRARHLIARAMGEPEAFPLDDVDGVTLAELSGMFAFSPNVRPPSVRYEIDYPFTTSFRPSNHRIPLADLVVAHDDATGMVRLCSQHGNSRIVPLHIGMMADGLLSPAARLLTQAFGQTYYLHPSQPLLVTPEMFTDVDDIIVQERMEIGKVILQRARWVVPIAHVPVRDKGETDADYLIRLVTWLRATGIPDRCFVRMWADADDLTVEGGPATKWLTDKSRKPVYVDFANLFLVMSFERMLNRPGAVVVFEEAVPDPAEAIGPDPDDPKVTEFLVELTSQETCRA